jgi:hypothetical protein
MVLNSGLKMPIPLRGRSCRATTRRDDPISPEKPNFFSDARHRHSQKAPAIRPHPPCFSESEMIQTLKPCFALGEPFPRLTRWPHPQTDCGCRPRTERVLIKCCGLLYFQSSGCTSVGHHFTAPTVKPAMKRSRKRLYKNATGRLAIRQAAINAPQ